MPKLQGYTEADLARLKSITVRARGWSHHIRPRVREYRDQRGHWVKLIRSTGLVTRMRREGQDAHIILPHIRIDPWVGVTEEHT